MFTFRGGRGKADRHAAAALGTARGVIRNANGRPSQQDTALLGDLVADLFGFFESARRAIVDGRTGDADFVLIFGHRKFLFIVRNIVYKLYHSGLTMRS